jgi:galactokinase
LHFFGENERVARMVAALRDRRFDDYLRLMADSGRSSGMFLQNCASKGDGSDQSVIVALALTERFFESSGLGNGRGAACRVHGGGFAGTIQVLLPVDAVHGYADFIETYLGAGAVTELHIRPAGAVAW